MRKTGSITPWLVLGCGFGYATLTLFAAYLAVPAAPHDAAGAAFQKLSRIAEFAGAIPGAGIWPHLIDVQGKLAGSFPTPLVGGMACFLGCMFALKRVSDIKAARAHDAAIDYEEERREQVRQRMRK